MCVRRNWTFTSSPNPDLKFKQCVFSLFFFYYYFLLEKIINSVNGDGVRAPKEDSDQISGDQSLRCCTGWWDIPRSIWSKESWLTIPTSSIPEKRNKSSSYCIIYTFGCWEIVREEKKVKNQLSDLNFHLFLFGQFEDFLGRRFQRAGTHKILGRKLTGQ